MSDASLMDNGRAARHVLSLPELKDAELSILLAFDEFCRQRHLRYSIGYGTLLGAIRHGGYIPWDDDIDVVMPRNDYKIFIREFPAFAAGNCPKLTLAGELCKGSDSLTFEKILDTTVVIEERDLENTPYSFAWMDVFPLDGMGNNRAMAHALSRFAILLKHAFLLERAAPTQKGGFKDTAKSILKPIAKRMRLTSLTRKMIRGLARRFDYESSRYVSNLSWHTYPQDIIDRLKDAGYCEVMFEGHPVRAFASWDSWLRDLYGDYMTLPPESARVAHCATAWRLIS